MGKKKNKGAKQLRKFLKSNRVVIAALSGAATGIALAAIIGTEKAKDVINTIQSSIKDFDKNLEKVGPSGDKNKPDKNIYQASDEQEARRKRPELR